MNASISMTTLWSSFYSCCPHQKGNFELKKLHCKYLSMRSVQLSPVKRDSILQAVIQRIADQGMSNGNL